MRGSICIEPVEPRGDEEEKKRKRKPALQPIQQTPSAGHGMRTQQQEAALAELERHPIGRPCGLLAREPRSAGRGSLRDDVDAVLAVAARDSMALVDAAPALWADRHFALAAVHIHGWALGFCSHQLRATKSIVLAAVLTDGGAIKHAASAMCADKEVALVAVAQDPSSLNYVAEALRRDTSVRQLAALEDRMLVQEMLRLRLYSFLEYCPKMAAHRVTPAMLPSLSSAELRKIGMASSAKRAAFLAAVAPEPQPGLGLGLGLGPEPEPEPEDDGIPSTPPASRLLTAIARKSGEKGRRSVWSRSTIEASDGETNEVVSGADDDGLLPAGLMVEQARPASVKAHSAMRKLRVVQRLSGVAGLAALAGDSATSAPAHAAAVVAVPEQIRDANGRAHERHKTDLEHDEDAAAEAPAVHSVTLDDMPEGLSTVEQLKWKKANGLVKSKPAGDAAAKRRRGSVFVAGGPAPPPGLTKIEQIKWKKKQDRQNANESQTAASGDEAEAHPVASPAPAPATSARPTSSLAAAGGAGGGRLTLADMPQSLSKLEELKWKKANLRGGGSSENGEGPTMPEGLSAKERMKWKREHRGYVDSSKGTGGKTKPKLTAKSSVVSSVELDKDMPEEIRNSSKLDQMKWRKKQAALADRDSAG
eukprot:COSAG06_NODE_934_length_11440_cov_5.939335_6_plen_648_part_00